MSYEYKLALTALILVLLMIFTVICMLACIKADKEIVTRPNKNKKHSDKYIEIYKKHFITSVTVQTVTQGVREFIKTDNMYVITINDKRDENLTFKFKILSHDKPNEIIINRSYDDIYECATTTNLITDILLELQEEIINLYLTV